HVEGDPHLVARPLRAQHHLVVPGVTLHRRAEVDGRRQHQAAGVVGVVADQVDPAWRERSDSGHLGQRSWSMAADARSSSDRSQGARMAMFSWSAPASTYSPMRSTSWSGEPMSTPGRTKSAILPN